MTFGTLPDGRAVTAHTLKRGPFTMVLLDHGARLQALHIEGISESLTLPSKDAAELEGTAIWNGPVIGPVLNRIGGAKANIDGSTYSFTPNEGANLLHSGNSTTATLIWDTEISEDVATFGLTLKDGFGGFTGNRKITATYTLTDDGFTLDIIATTDAPTLMNVGHHPNWTLGGGDLSLQIDADRYLPVNASTLPTGEIAAVDGTEFDFRSPRVPPKTIDHNFCLNQNARIALQGPHARLDIETDAPGLQIYTGKTGIAVEPQLWPDAPNNPNFPSITLAPGDTFRQLTRYRISAR